MPSKKSPTERGYHSVTVSDDTFKALLEWQKVYSTPTMAATVERVANPNSPVAVESEGVKYTVEDIRLAMKVAGMTTRTIDLVVSSLESL